MYDILADYVASGVPEFQNFVWRERLSFIVLLLLGVHAWTKSSTAVQEKFHYDGGHSHIIAYARLTSSIKELEIIFVSHIEESLTISGGFRHKFDKQDMSLY